MYTTRLLMLIEPMFYLQVSLLFLNSTIAIATSYVVETESRDLNQHVLFLMRLNREQEFIEGFLPQKVKQVWNVFLVVDWFVDDLEFCYYAPPTLHKNQDRANGNYLRIGSYSTVPKWYKPYRYFCLKTFMFSDEAHFEDSCFDWMAEEYFGGTCGSAPSQNGGAAENCPRSEDLSEGKIFDNFGQSFVGNAGNCVFEFSAKRCKVWKLPRGQWSYKL